MPHVQLSLLRAKQGLMKVMRPSGCDGSNEWRKSPDKDHAYLVRKMDPKKISAVIEQLMLRHR